MQNRSKPRKHCGKRVPEPTWDRRICDLCGKEMTRQSLQYHKTVPILGNPYGRRSSYGYRSSSYKDLLVQGFPYMTHFFTVNCNKSGRGSTQELMLAHFGHVLFTVRGRFLRLAVRKAMRGRRRELIDAHSRDVFTVKLLFHG